ncbi:hypothetical protein LCGC14_0267870 [marine sediment metagenome]|uniref:Uncharacterized protein n=1 Tax=marine sediment metagenome TaxID=412755 RepID=A0A0F9WKR6_9ZZZZ
MVLRAVAVYWYTNRDALLRPLSVVLDASRILNLLPPSEKEREALINQEIGVQDYFAECIKAVVLNFSTPDFDPKRDHDTHFLMRMRDKYERATSPQEKIEIGSVSQLENKEHD